jgi:hypothetical protein
MKTQLPSYKIAIELGLRFLDEKTFELFWVWLNRLGLVFFGLVFIWMAYAALFGPIGL